MGVCVCLKSQCIKNDDEKKNKGDDDGQTHSQSISIRGKKGNRWIEIDTLRKVMERVNESFDLPSLELIDKKKKTKRNTQIDRMKERKTSRKR